MPITQADLQPFLQNLPSAYSGNVRTTPSQSSGGGGGGIPNLNPFARNTSGIGSFISNPATNPMAAIDPLGGILSGLLFGGGEPAWQPYVNEQGQYVWEDPNRRNPVPVASVPGAPLRPNLNYRKFSGNAQALYDILPYLNQAINQGIVPTAIAQLQASQATSPAYADLMTQVYNTYGPQLNAIGNEILRRNALSQAETEGAVLSGPGQGLVRGAYDLSQIFDKPYYDARAQAGSRLSDLLNSIDLSGGLSGTERNEIAQGLAREGVQRGTLNAPSASQTVSNAMRYGEKGYQRTQQAKSNLADALAKASAFLPAAKSGVDVFQVATGRPSSPNPGQSLFPGINTNTQGNSNNMFGLAGSTLGGMNQMDIAQANIQAQKKDWADYLSQVSSSIGDITSGARGAVGMLGMCWVAREVYGANNFKWLEFRNWIINDAPTWVFNLYKKFGESFAKFIRNKPFFKSIIRKWMDIKVYENRQKYFNNPSK